MGMSHVTHGAASVTFDRCDLWQDAPVSNRVSGAEGRGTTRAHASICCAATGVSEGKGEGEEFVVGPARGRVGARKMTQEVGCQREKLCMATAGGTQTG